MTWEDFESELKHINGVTVRHENDGLGNFLVVHIREIKTDYFLISLANSPDTYMAYHYILLVRMLAGCM